MSYTSVSLEPGIIFVVLASLSRCRLRSCSSTSTCRGSSSRNASSSFSLSPCPASPSPPSIFSSSPCPASPSPPSIPSRKLLSWTGLAPPSPASTEEVLKCALTRAWTLFLQEEWNRNDCSYYYHYCGNHMFLISDTCTLIIIETIIQKV